MLTFQTHDHEAPYMEKLWSPIPNQSNIEGWNWKNKKNSIIQKDPKPKLEIKRIRIKIDIKNKLDDNYQFSIEEWNWKEKSL